MIIEYQKNTASKAQNEKRIAFRFSRHEQSEHTLARKKSFNRRWSKTSQKQIQELSQEFPGRNLFTFKAFFNATTSKNLYARKKKYIYINYLLTTKKSEYMSNAQKWASITVNTNKLFKNDDVGPDYVTPMSDNAYYATSMQRRNIKNAQSTTQNTNAIQTAQKNTQKQEGRSNVSAYKLWIEEQRPILDPFEEAKRLSDIKEMEHYKDFVNLVGQEVADRLFKNTLAQAIERKYGSNP